ncbi:glycosyl hydrolase [Thalassobacillus devorans]|uniref:Glycosyl hydrolase n=1 Tax=Thalassobacillus devorans TaxID=279813 RepID=A0ABQ1NTU3_9BACI|nr:alpha-mannosidase [Thalassobacillus devorans]NIK28579.1 alpha-mannosidase [Thalassobacillus devorans]GGC85125.1 glycosyl hydrolase [Thalassobacillus devorans]
MSVTATKQTAYIISHSHWDREWYMSLEEHRYYLVKLIDDVLNQLENNPDFHSFHMDGQTIMVDDYLEVRPENRERVEKQIKEGRMVIGPWYILQDAFLTSSEANLRNLLYGKKDMERWGQEGGIGYFPDTFGIYGQAPQILKQANMGVAAFGRGVTPTGFNNQVFQNEYSSPYSELSWEAPDGSSVLGILFANWYSNGNEIPVEEEAAKNYWNKKLEESGRYASTKHLLYMNGCDHQPVQTDVTTAIERANQLYPDVQFKHASFQEYVANVKNDLPESLQTIQGELRNQKTDGWSTLVNTASARIYLKQANDHSQTLLENYVEPLGLFASDRSFYRSYTEYFWKLLMQNHPHDSICGCSVDSVHREMATRFEKVSLGAQKFLEEQMQQVTQTIDTTHNNPEAIPLVVFHTSGKQASKVVKAKVMVKKIYFEEMDFQKIPEKLNSEELPEYVMELDDGREISCDVKDLGVRFGYDLPHDGFRRPYYGREVEVTFLQEEANRVGYNCCFLIPHTSRGNKESLIWNSKEKRLENETVVVEIHANGSYSLTDKRTNHTYPLLGIYENTGDIGNEYMYKQSSDGNAITSANEVADIEVLEDSPLSAKIRLHSSLTVPLSADEQLQKEREKLIWHPERRAGRSDETTVIPICTTLTLDKGANGLKVDVAMDNTGRDHRMRALFPVGGKAEHHYADSIFEIVKRPNEPEQEWTNPSVMHHMQRFVSMNDDRFGLTIAGKGLHEYEIIDKDTIAITLLRAVGEMGDWGVFETPEAQCQGINHASFMIIPHESSVLESKAYLEAYSYPYTPPVVQDSQHPGELPKTGTEFHWEGDLALTSVKVAEGESGTVLRWYNPNNHPVTLSLAYPDAAECYLSDVLEQKNDRLGGTTINRTVNPFEIVTLVVTKKKEKE